MNYVNCFNQRTVHHFPRGPTRPNLLDEQAMVRQQYVNDRLGWGMPSFDGGEFDPYDTRMTEYLSFHGRNGRMIACARLCPTKPPQYDHRGHPLTYMLLDEFSHAARPGELEQSDKIIEASRFSVIDDITKEERGKIVPYMGLAIIERALAMQAEWIYVVMYEGAKGGFWGRIGTPIEELGPPTAIKNDSQRIEAFKIPVSEEILTCVQEKTEIHRSVLRYQDPGISDGSGNHRAFKKEERFELV